MFHLHIVDSGDQRGVTAAQIMAHLTLRCGHLEDVLVVSASTAPHPTKGIAATNGANPAAATTAVVAGGEEEGDEHLLLRAAKALREGPSAPAVASLPFLRGQGEHAIAAYPYFQSSFMEAERSLAEACTSSSALAGSATPVPGYFDFVAVTDMGSYEYIRGYYAKLRLARGGTRIPHRVGIFLVLCNDASRMCALVQHFVEALVRDAPATPWLDAVDAAVEAFSQTLSVHVMITVV